MVISSPAPVPFCRHARMLCWACAPYTPPSANGAADCFYLQGWLLSLSGSIAHSLWVALARSKRTSAQGACRCTARVPFGHEFGECSKPSLPGPGPCRALCFALCFVLCFVLLLLLALILAGDALLCRRDGRFATHLARASVPRLATISCFVMARLLTVFQTFALARMLMSLTTPHKHRQGMLRHAGVDAAANWPAARARRSESVVSGL